MYFSKLKLIFPKLAKWIKKNKKALKMSFLKTLYIISNTKKKSGEKVFHFKTLPC